MKRLIPIICLLLVIAQSSFAQVHMTVHECTYYGETGKIVANSVPGKIMVKKVHEFSQYVFEQQIKDIDGEVSFSWYNPDVCTIIVTPEKMDQLYERLMKDDNIVSVRNVLSLEYPDYHEFGITDEIVVGWKSGQMSDEIKEDIKMKYNIRLKPDAQSFDECEIWLIEKNADMFEIIRCLKETGHFTVVQPGPYIHVQYFDITPVYPNDPYFQYQRALYNIGQTVNGKTGTYDADIDMPEAWGITMGDANVVVAVIDDGVVSNHPDLPNSRQIRLAGSNFEIGDDVDHNDPSPVGNNNHGNACAGIIAASINNGLGIAGIAPHCKIMPIRIGSTENHQNVGDAIRFAVDNGANVISCSWGYDYGTESFYISNAIQYAINHNVFVCCAAGNNAKHTLNDDGYVSFPANLNYSGMMCVGASDRDDLQSDFSPSNIAIDIVAPSNKAYPFESNTYSGIIGEYPDMWTIDIPGNAGDNPHPAGDPMFAVGSKLPASGPDSLDYTGRFGGTSYACPVVAGVAALLLSEDITLSPQAICSILKNTADKIGPYDYTTNNGRSLETGYGRVNAFKALKSICTTKSFTHDDIISDTIISGCKIYLEDVNVLWNSKLKLKIRENAYIPNTFFVEPGSYFEIR